MAKDASTTAPAKERKPRRPARTLDEQIAELKAKAEARENKAKAKATKELEEIESKIVVAESKLAGLYEERAAARAVLGLEVEGTDALFQPDSSES